jgi:ribosomal protein S18 acetylase RimI-like enzyme
MEKIRLATENDFEIVAELETSMSKQNSQGSPDIFKYTKEAMPKEYYLKEISERNMYVLEADNIIIGYYWARIIEIADDVRIKHQKMYFVFSIVIKEEFIGKGYGKKLFDHIENEAKSKGCKTVELNVWDYNKHAKEFYKKAGLEEKYTVMKKMVKY